MQREDGSTDRKALVGKLGDEGERKKSNGERGGRGETRAPAGGESSRKSLHDSQTLQNETMFAVKESASSCAMLAEILTVSLLTVRIRLLAIFREAEQSVEQFFDASAFFSVHSSFVTLNASEEATIDASAKESQFIFHVNIEKKHR